MLTERFILHQAYDSRKVASSLKPKAHVFLESNTRLLTREQVEHLSDRRPKTNGLTKLFETT